MLGNGIRQATTTNGTGNLTLAAVAGYPKVADVVPVGFPVAYGLVDSNGLLIEEGIGRLADAATFVRALVTATYSGGIYAGGPASTSTPSAVSLTGTTTLIVTPNAATLESMLPTVDAISSGPRRYLASAHRNGAFTPTGPSTLNVQYHPFLLRAAAQITSLAVNCTSPTADRMRAGLYTCTDKGYMGSQIVSTGDIDLSTSGFKPMTLAAPLSLPPGWYFTAAIATSGGPRLTGYTSGAGNIVNGSPLGFDTSMTSIEFRTEGTGSLVLPVTASATTGQSVVGNSHPIAIFLGTQ